MRALYRFRDAPEPQGLDRRSWFRFMIVPDMAHTREDRAKMTDSIQAYRSAPKPARLISSAPTVQRRTWRDKLNDLLNPLDAFVDVHSGAALQKEAVRQARLYPLLRFLRRTPPALDKLAQANADTLTMPARPNAFTPAERKADEARWREVVDPARERAHAELLRTRAWRPTPN